MLERLLHLIEKYPLNLISHLCSSLPIIVGLIQLKFLTKGLKLLLLLFALYFISDSYSLWLSIVRSSTFPIQNLQPLLEIWLVAAIYLACVQRQSSTVFIKYSIAFCSIIIIINYRNDAISTIALTSQRVFEAVVALLYFNEIITNGRVKNVLLHSMFWVSAGLLFYSTGTFFFSLFSSYLYSNNVSNEEFDPFWQLNQILHIIFCFIASVGLWVSKYDQENIV